MLKILTQDVWAKWYADKYIIEKIKHFSKKLFIQSFEFKIWWSWHFGRRAAWVMRPPAEQGQKRKEFADVSQNWKKIADWAQNRMRFTYVARKQKKRAGAKNQWKKEEEKKGKHLMKQSKNWHVEAENKKRRTSGNRAEMKSLRNQSGLKKRSYWTSAMAWLQQLVLLGQWIFFGRAE